MAAYFNGLMNELKTNKEFETFYSAKTEIVIAAVCGVFLIIFGVWMSIPVWVFAVAVPAVYVFRCKRAIQHRRLISKLKRLSIEDTYRLVGIVQGVVGENEIDDLKHMINTGGKNKILKALKQFSTFRDRRFDLPV